MSRTNRGSKHPGYEYWSRRRLSGWNPGNEAKRLTNRIERRTQKQKDRDGDDQ